MGEAQFDCGTGKSNLTELHRDKITARSMTSQISFKGIRQDITFGNLNENQKIYLFLMDYHNQTRIKIRGTAKVVDDNPELLSTLHDPRYRGKAERIILIAVQAGVINCQ